MQRRPVLQRLVAVGGASALAACLDIEFGDNDADIPSGDPTNRLNSQHAWNDHLSTDDHGNRLLPAHHLFLSLSYEGRDRDADRTVVEHSFTDLEDAYAADPDGLLFTVGYSPTYFKRFDEQLDVDLPAAGPVVPEENVRTDDADVFVHLASNHASVVLEAEQALFGNRTANGTDVTTLEGLFELADSEESRRTGFIGPELPAERDQNLQGLPSDEVHENASTFMNFRSGFRGSQATERRVTLLNGRFAGGTTQHVEWFVHTLGNWFDHSTQEQVNRLFSPSVDAEDVGPLGERLTTDNRVEPVTEDQLTEIATDEGVIGHAQKMARFREDGQPPILRRDVNTDDGSEAGVVFLSLQRTFSAFRKLRLAMAGRELAAETPVGERANNGILQYVRTRRRGNFLVASQSRLMFVTVIYGKITVIQTMLMKSQKTVGRSVITPIHCAIDRGGSCPSKAAARILNGFATRPGA